MTYESPKQPVWASKKKTWYRTSPASAKNWGMASNGYGKSWAMYNSYYAPASTAQTGGKHSRYFKDYTLYRKAAKQGNTKYEPAYYYGQVFPLSAFKVECDALGNVYNVYKFCWNKAYVPPTPINLLPVAIQLEMERGALSPNCPVSAAQNTTLLTGVSVAGAYLLTNAPYNTVIGNLTLDTSGPSACVPETATANATVTYLAAASPMAGQDLDQLIAGLNATNLAPGTDLCSLSPALAADCQAISALHMIIAYDTDVKVTQFQLSKRAVRNKLRKLQKVGGHY